MNRKKLYIILAAESAVIAMLYVMTANLPDSFSSIWNFPFEQIGAGLRVLHGLGSAGSGVACALWVGISLLPVIPAARERGLTAWERAVLVLLALSVFAALYVMTNPWKIGLPYDDDGTLAKLMLSVTTWSILILYLVMRIVRLMHDGGMEKLMGYFYKALYALAMLCAANIVAYGAGTVQTAAVSQTGADALFALLRFAAAELPYIMNIVIIVCIGEFIDAARIGDGALLSVKADRLTKLCCISLVAAAALTVGFNILQVIFVNSLMNVMTSLQIPVFSIAFTLFALLLTRIIVENRRLRDDNELFI